MDKIDVGMEAKDLKRIGIWIFVYDILCIGVLGFIIMFSFGIGMGDSGIFFSFNFFTNAAVMLFNGLISLGLIFGFIFLFVSGVGLFLNKKWARKASIIGIWLGFILAFGTIALAFTWHIAEIAEYSVPIWGLGNFILFTTMAAIIAVPGIFILKRLNKIFPEEGKPKRPKVFLTKVIIPVAIIVVLVIIFQLVFYTQRYSIIVLYPKKIMQRASQETRFHIKILRSENDIDTLKEALSILEKIADVHAITTLIEIAWGGPPQLSKSVIPSLIKVRLGSKDINILKETLPALEMIADVHTIAALKEATQGGPPQLSKSVIPSLIKVRLGSKDDIDTLKEALSTLEKIADIYSYKIFAVPEKGYITVFTRENFLSGIADGHGITAEIELAWGRASEVRKSSKSSLIRIGKPAIDPLVFMTRFGSYKTKKWTTEILKEIKGQLQ